MLVALSVCVDLLAGAGGLLALLIFSLCVPAWLFCLLCLLRVYCSGFVGWWVLSYAVLFMLCCLGCVLVCACL